jgi:carbon starvation protein
MPHMTILPVVAICGFILLVAYFTYGKLVMRWLGIDPSRPTPATELNDGVDYCPAPPGVVLGGHFTAIAAAGPVVGPILAGLAFGWLPALVWIMIGAILIGGVHDSGALLASIRHKAASITQVVREHMSRPAYLMFLIFVWIALVYVIIAFADVTASTFGFFDNFNVIVDGQPTTIPLNGGAVAIGATAYLLLSVVLGLLLRFTKMPWWVGLIGAVALLSLTIWKAPDLAAWLANNGLSFLNTSGNTPEQTGTLIKRWDQVLLVYCFIASITPMWLLLQPRGVIGAAFLYATLFFGVVGAVVGGLSNADSLQITWPAFSGFFADPKTAPGMAGAWLFPFLFITIACGACSGFHSIVASGTTSKQIRAERDIKPIGYGSMLLEAMVALFALSCVMVMVPGTTGKPDAIYARGIGNFMHMIGIDMKFAIAFGLLAFSSFVFDTLDVCTRLGRYVLQEITGLKGWVGGAVATVLTLAMPSLYLAYMPPKSFMTFWVLFGTSNQLLAAMTLVGVSVWLWRTGRPVWFALVPAIFMLITTGFALVMNFLAFMDKQSISPSTMNITNMVIAVALLGLSMFVAFEALRVYLQSRRPVAVASLSTPEG